MRRCTQASIVIELVGSQCAKMFFAHGDAGGFLCLSEQAMSNASFIMLFKFLVMWWYQGYTRDHILARHVSRITLARPLNKLHRSDPIVAYIEARPWTYRIEFRRGQSDEGLVSLGRLMEIGALHVDLKRGELSDQEALELILSEDVYIESEELLLDKVAQKSAYVGNYEPPDLRTDDSTGTYAFLSGLPPLAKRPLQLDGRYAYWNFCWLALALSIGSVLLWLPEDIAPRPSFLAKEKPARKFDY